jgi:hypothetical protein
MRTIRFLEEKEMPKRKRSIAKSNARTKRRAWTKADHRDLKAHSKSKTPVAKISRLMKRTMGAIRQQAHQLGIGLGHRR